MPSSYTTSLRLTLPATGELAGQWGQTVNTGITELLDAAVAGTTTISTWGGPGVAYTLSNNSGTADEARRMFIVATGTPGEAKNVICPAVSKMYVFRNDTTGGFALTLKTSGGTGIAVPAGQYKLLYCDGTNVVEAVNSLGPVASLSASQAVFTDASKNLVSNAITGTGNVVMSTSPTLVTPVLGAATATSLNGLTVSSTTGTLTLANGSTLATSGANALTLTTTGATNVTLPTSGTLATTAGTVASFSAGSTGFTPSTATTGAVTLAGTLATTNGGTGLTSFTSGGVVYASSTSALATGSALTFDGTNLSTSGSLISSVAPAIGTLKRDVTSSYLSITGGTSPNSNGATILLSGSTYVAANTAFVDATESVFRSLNGASEYMRLTTTGLGIGTSSPAYKLDVNGQVRVNNDFLISDASAIRGRLYGDATGVLWRAESGLAQRWAIGSTEVMRLDSSGNLGIGTSSPTQKLTVSGSAAFSTFGINANPIDTTSTAQSFIRFLSTGGDFYVGTESSTGGLFFPGSTAYAAVLYNSASTPMQFYTAGSLRATLDASGNLGIGTTSPTQLFHAQKDQAAYTWARVDNQSSSASAYSGWMLGAFGNSWGMAIGSSAANSNALTWVIDAGGANSEKMRLDSSGNLGLGVTPSAWGGAFAGALQVGRAVMHSNTGDFRASFGQNYYVDGTNARYIGDGFATQLMQVSGEYRFFTAPNNTSGAGAGPISFTQALTLDANRNLALNTTSVGTSAAGVLSVGSGTEPSSGPADTVQFYSVDRSAGNTIPAIYCEGSGVTNAGITNVTVTNKIAIKINGTVYYLLATTNAT